MAMSHNTSAFNGSLEHVVDTFIERAVDTSMPVYFANKPILGKRKQGDQETQTVQELYYFFYKALKERKLLSIWTQKKAVEKYRWRLDEIDTIMKTRGGPPITKVEKAMQHFLEDLSSELYSDLFQ